MFSWSSLQVGVMKMPQINYGPFLAGIPEMQLEHMKVTPTPQGLTIVVLRQDMSFRDEQTRLFILYLMQDHYMSERELLLPLDILEERLKELRTGVQNIDLSRKE